MKRQAAKKQMPGPMRLERSVSKKAPKDHMADSTPVRRTIWERIIADDIIDDEPPKGGRSK